MSKNSFGWRGRVLAGAMVCGALGATQPARAATNYTILGWNNLGMHCMDSDYSIFSVLPPFNSFQAQVIKSINNTQTVLMTASSISLTYQSVADPDGSINRISTGKTGFWDYAQKMFGVVLPPETGLPVPGPAGFAMPGVSNVPQSMAFESAQNWFTAYGVPITPYDDTARPNTYPMMRIVLKNGSVTQAFTDIVLPVSDEMDCRMCHLSGSADAAKPAAGWINNPMPGHDYRLNILRLHDERQLANPVFTAALATKGFNTNGLFASVTRSGTPILCAACHLSEALPGSGVPGIPPLTSAIHSRHAGVVDPRNGQTLDSSANRVSCYTCHPGSATRCLRGAMGKAVAADGSMAMQCQSCHGNMSTVGSPARTGWLQEPNCQACHVGSATNRFGTIRYLSAFSTGSVLRLPAEQLFATSSNTPAAGISLYRFSSGHGGLQCSACHGSTHAEFPSAGRNDNLQSIRVQGHAGIVSECTSCHGTQSLAANGGPHGMHPVGQTWVSGHQNASRAQCAACHGADLHGTVLSRMQADRTLSALGTKNFYRGTIIGCWSCHNGPSNTNGSTNTPPVATSRSASTASGVSVAIPLTTTDVNNNPLTLRIISQAAHGTVALSGTTATYFPDAGFVGTDTFTFAARDTMADSNLGTVTITVTAPDSDGDGIPDWWAQKYFGHPTAQAADHSRAADDPDGDGVNNLAEYRASTDPLDYRSTMELTAIQISPSLQRLQIPTSLGQQFSIQASTRLDGVPAWTPVVTNIYGHQDSVTIDLTNAPSAVRFFRVVTP